MHETAATFFHFKENIFLRIFSFKLYNCCEKNFLSTNIRWKNSFESILAVPSLENVCMLKNMFTWLLRVSKQLNLRKFEIF